MKIREISIIFIMIIVTALINLSGVFDSLNETIYNYYFFFNREKTINKDVVLVKIDLNTIKNAGSWPLNREVYTRAMDKIIQSRPAVIGMVIAFTEKVDSKTDEKLYNTLKSFKNIVLIAKYKTDKIGDFSVEVPETTIFPDLKYGHTLVNFSKNNTVIGFEPYNVHPAFSMEVAKLYFNYIKRPLTSLPAQYYDKNSNNTNFTPGMFPVDYKRTVDKFNSISFIDILNDKFNSSIFKNKIVLIGITDRFNTTLFSTPYTSIDKQLSTAVELQAQFIDSIINYRGFTILNNLYIYILSIILAFVFYLLTRKSQILLQGLYLFLLVLVIIYINYSMFTFLAYWFPPVLPLSMLVSIFATYIYLTSFNIDNHVRKSLENLKNIDSLNLKEIPQNVDSKVEALTSLIDIINHDRQAIKVIVDGVNSVIFVFNDTGEIIWQNLRFKDYFDSNGEVPSSVETLFEDFNLIELRESIQQNGYYKKDHAIGTKDFICYVNLISVENKEYVTILNDVTELKELDRLKTDMVRMVSHELKNPLACIQLCAENILDLDNRDFTVHNAESITKTTELLIDTVNNFLNLSRLENNMVEINPVKTDLCQIINTSIETQSAIALNKDIKITFKPPEKTFVMADPKHLLVVVNNLLANAIKYSFKDSEIVISCVENNGNIITSVKDSGLGIPEDEVGMIFEKFFRSRNNKENNIEGTGLGLSIIKTIIEKHNGKIWVESKEKRGQYFQFFPA